MRLGKYSRWSWQRRDRNKCHSWSPILSPAGGKKNSIRTILSWATKSEHTWSVYARKERSNGNMFWLVGWLLRRGLIYSKLASNSLCQGWPWTFAPPIIHLPNAPKCILSCLCFELLSLRPNARATSLTPKVNFLKFVSVLEFGEELTLSLSL